MGWCIYNNMELNNITIINDNSNDKEIFYLGKFVRKDISDALNVDQTIRLGFHGKFKIDKKITKGDFIINFNSNNFQKSIKISNTT